MEDLRACFEPGLRCSSVAGQLEGHVIVTGRVSIEVCDVCTLGAVFLSLCC
jgi:hypothetical protein